MSELKQLEAELAALQPTPVTAINQQPKETIADDDPELLAFMEAENAERAEARKTFGALDGFFKPLTLAEAKELLLKQKLSEKLFAIVSDESQPMPQRVAAVRRMRTERGLWPHTDNAPHPDVVTGLKDEEAVECFLPHPHQARLKELYEIVNDPAQRTSLQPWEPRVEAVKEFRRLRQEHPRRYVGFCVLPDAEQTIAFWYSHNDPEHGKTRDTYRMILERAGVIA